jgi:tetratricopeptide (TPR) repeat protein
MKLHALAALTLLPAALAAQPAPAPMPGGGPGPGGPPPGAAPRARRGPGGPGDPVFFLAQEIRALDEKVSLLVEVGKPDAAIAAAKGAEAIDIPKGHPAYELKVHLLARTAQIYADTGRKKEALEALAKIGADVPKDGPAEAAYLLDAGRVYRKLKMSDEALKAFDRVIELSDKLAKEGRRPDGALPRQPRPMGASPAAAPEAE